MNDPLPVPGLYDDEGWRRHNEEWARRIAAKYPGGKIPGVAPWTKEPEQPAETPN